MTASKFLLATASLAAILAATGPSRAQQLPDQVVLTAYDVGGAGYAQAVAIGSAFKNDLGVTVRVLPGKNDVSRMEPLRQEKATFSLNGIGTYFSQEGVFTPFGRPDWGPQEVRIQAISASDACLTMTFAKDAGIQKMEDVKGKRVAWVKGAPALNHNNLAYLRFGNLTWDDVEKIEVGGNNAAWDAVYNDQADAVFSITNNGTSTRLAASPRGIAWPVLPHENEEAWARLLDAAPYYVKHTCSDAAGDPEPWQGATYPYPILMNYVSIDADTTYAMTKAMFETFDSYKDSAPGANGWALDRQKLSWVVPYHDGAIRYYEEIGKWSADDQANNEKLIERQQVLKKLWGDYANGASSDEEAFAKGWQKARYEGLKAAGFNPVWQEW